MSNYSGYDTDEGLPPWRIQQILNAFSQRLHVYAVSEQAEKDYERYVDRMWTQTPAATTQPMPNDVPTDVRTTGLEVVQSPLFDDVA